MMIEKEQIEGKLRGAFNNAAHIEVRDMTGTQDHFEVTIVDPAFKGKSLVERHQLVYQALGAWVGREIHALALSTYDPEQWT